MIEPGTARRWRESIARHKQHCIDRDLLISGGRETVRTKHGYIQLFCTRDVNQGDFEHCLHRDAYQLWKCRDVR